MALQFRQFRNKVTGQVCYVEAGRYGNFKNALKKLVNYIRYNIARYYVAHLTLTVAENVTEIDFKHLHRVLQFIAKRLERKESDFKYVAVKEIQERGALHYHVLCIYSKPYIFPGSGEIEKSWRLGFVKVTAPKLRLKVGKIANYIGKYIGKGYEYEALDLKKSFTASQIKQIYKLTTKRLDAVMLNYGKDVAEKLKCTYRKIFQIVESAECEDYSTCKKFRYRSPFPDCDRIRRTARCKKKIMEFASDWAYEGICAEPF